MQKLGLRYLKRGQDAGPPDHALRVRDVLQPDWLRVLPDALVVMGPGRW